MSFFYFFTGVTRHYYQVSFSPLHSTTGPTDKQKYVNLYSSKSFQSYIQVHEKTVASSKCPDVVDIKYIETKQMLDDMRFHYLSKGVVDYAMGPLVVFNPVAPHKRLDMPLRDENVKNKFFINALSFILPEEFLCGPISVPVREPFSKYGMSRPNVCVCHEKYIHPAAALLSWVKPPSTDTEALRFIRNETKDDTFDVFEFKNKGYAEQQAVKEMMCAAGNLTANVLSTGTRPRNVIVYGMAADYDTKEGKLLILNIDFCNNVAETYCSDDITSIWDGVNWMISGISPNNN